MASINPPAVSPGDDTEAAWANRVVSHVVATFATVAERDQQIPSPELGRVVSVESTDHLLVYQSTGWEAMAEGSWVTSTFLKLTGGTMTGALAIAVQNTGVTVQRWETKFGRALEMRQEILYGEMGWYSVNVANGTKRLFKVNLDSHDGLFAFDTPVKIHGVAELEGGLIMSAPALPTGGNDLYNVVWSGRTGKFHRKPL